MGLASLALTWLVSPSSPLHHYLDYPSDFTMFWGQLNFVPYFAVIVLGRGALRGLEWIIYGSVLFVQWFMIGYVLYALFSRTKEPPIDLFGKS